jgi:Ankyrin repeats (3 copies)
MTGREHSDSGQPHDALNQRYLEASAQDTRRPAERVRAAVLAHAQMQLAQGDRSGAEKHVAQPTTQTPAANQSRWKISLLASIALAGLTGLLVLQFERGTPDEKEVALGQKPTYESAAPSPSPSTSAAPESPAAPEALPQLSQPPLAARPTPPVASKESSQLKPSPAPQPSTSVAPPRSPAAPAPSPSPFPASPQSPSLPSPSTAESPASLADAPSANPRAPNPATEPARADESAAARSGDAAPRAAPPPPAPAAAAVSPAPAARALAPGQKPNGFNADAARAREETGSAGSRTESAAPNLLNKQEATLDARTALQQAARNGSIAQLERLLAQGVPLQSVLNAPDAAGRTPLVLAVINGHAAMVQRLLALGANPALVDQSGINALQHARQRGRADIAALIEAAP